MNVYEMYYANNKKFGYFIKRNSWGNTLAKVIKIEGVTEGQNIEGKPPYFKNQKVIAEYYKERDPKWCIKEVINNIGIVRCPGTYGYDLIKNTHP
ncbi:MAG: hypothetical protein ACK518_00105 [bacterium]